MVAVGAVVFGAGAIAQQTTTQQGTAYLRVVHASPDAPAVDVYVDNTSALTDVPFGNVSDYLTLDSGVHTVTITPAGDNQTVVFRGNVTLDPRSASTLYAAGEVSQNASTTFGPIVAGNDAFTPGPNTSAVRFVHLSPDAPPVDVTTQNGTEVLADNLSYGNASDYMTVPAGNHTIEIRAATPGNNGTIVRTVDVSLSNRTAYSAVAVGYLDPETAPAGTPLDVLVTEDASITIHLPGVTPGNQTTQQNQTQNQTQQGGPS